MGKVSCVTAWHATHVHARMHACIGNVAAGEAMRVACNDLHLIFKSFNHSNPANHGGPLFQNNTPNLSASHFGHHFLSPFPTPPISSISILVSRLPFFLFLFHFFIIFASSTHPLTWSGFLSNLFSIISFMHACCLYVVMVLF